MKTNEKGTYFLLSGDELLTSESWLWINANKHLKEEDNHVVYVKLIRDIGSYLDGDLDSISSQIQEWKELYEDCFDRILVERVCFSSYGETDTKTFLVGERKESDKERDLRTENIKKERDKKQTLDMEKENNKQKLEYEKFLKLKKKFEGT